MSLEITRGPALRFGTGTTPMTASIMGTTIFTVTKYDIKKQDTKQILRDNTGTRLAQTSADPYDILTADFVVYGQTTAFVLPQLNTLCTFSSGDDSNVSGSHGTNWILKDIGLTATNDKWTEYTLTAENSPIQT